MTKRLSLLVPLLSLAFIASSCNSSKEDDKPTGKTAIVIKAKTDNGVILKERNTTKAEDPTQYFLTVTGPDGKLIDEEVLGSTQKTISDILPGSYTVTVASHKEADFNLPDFERKIFRGTMTKTIAEKESATFDITCTQMNVGVRFAFDPSVTSFFTSLVGTIAHSDAAEKKLVLTPTDGNKTGYFEAPSKLKISFTNDGNPVKIGGNDYAEIDVSPKELWTITFKTSSKTPGGMEMEVDVDEGTDGKDPEFGLGDVEGEGTLDSPFSVSDAINVMPANNAWVEGYVVGTKAITRSGALGNILLGRQADSPESQCLVIELPEGSDLSRYLSQNQDGNYKYFGKRIAFKGNISGKADFVTNAFGVMTDITLMNLEYAENYQTYSYKYPNATLKGSASFPIGTAVRHEQLESDPAYVKILKRDFNSVTSEYNMKMNVIWNGGSRDQFNFEGADKIVAFAQANGMRVHGHTLIWSQDNVIPDWVKNLNLDRAGWTQLMKDYIKGVVTHFAGKVASWDVVNEAFNNDDGHLRGSKPGDENTFWYDKVGEDFMKIAFQTAREALDAAGDHDCKLFYNDYLFVSDDKRPNMVQHLREMIADGAPIEGVGLQMHLNVRPDYDQIKAAFTDVASLGVLIHASEIDMLINNPLMIGNAQHPDDGGDPWTLGDEISMYELYYGVAGGNNFNLDYAQGKSYNMVVSAYMNEAIVPASQRYGISTWGFTDQFAYMNNITDYGHYDYPMMFGAFYNPKRAYSGVLEGLNGVDWQAIETASSWDWRWKQGYESKAPWE